MSRNLLKEAIADAKAVKETAIANAKVYLEEAFTPQLRSMLAAKLEEMDDDEINEKNQLRGMASLSAGIWIANIWNLKRIIKKDISVIPVNINMNAQGIVKITYRF